jgi:hypothetical protein
MPKTILTLLLVLIATHSLGAETLSVYRLNGAVQCSQATPVSPDAAADELRALGVAVIAAEKRPVPHAVAQMCGAPLGNANVLQVDAGDWSAFLRRFPDAKGFGVWLFDRPTVEVYKYDGSLQCQMGDEVPLDAMAAELEQAGVAVKNRRKGTDGLVHAALCGASSGVINVFEIDSAGLSTAQELGFQLLVTREMSNALRPSRPKQPSVQMRAPPRAPTGRDGHIPLLW